MQCCARDTDYLEVQGCQERAGSFKDGRGCLQKTPLRSQGLQVGHSCCYIKPSGRLPKQSTSLLLLDIVPPPPGTNRWWIVIVRLLTLVKAGRKSCSLDILEMQLHSCSLRLVLSGQVQAAGPEVQSHVCTRFSVTRLSCGG